MTDGCDACAAGPAADPAPGLDALGARLGRHADFLAGMTARVSRVGPRGLRTRDPADPAVAWLDAAAAVADVLSFYQERVADEGYLRPATEARSVAELARLVGYAPRPGVSAGCHLAYTLEKDHRAVLPAGTRASSTPGPNELPQVFETAEPLVARGEWSALRPRPTRPQVIEVHDGRSVSVLWLAGITTNLKPGDLLLLEFPDDSTPAPRRVQKVEIDPPTNRTRVELQIDALSALRPLLDARAAFAPHEAVKELNPFAAEADVTPVTDANTKLIDDFRTATPDGATLAGLDEALTALLPAVDAVRAKAAALAAAHTGAATAAEGVGKRVTVVVADKSAVAAALVARVAALRDEYTAEEAKLATFVAAFDLIKPDPAQIAATLKGHATTARDKLKPLADALALLTPPQAAKLVTAVTGLDGVLTSLEGRTDASLASEDDRKQFVNDFINSRTDFGRSAAASLLATLAPAVAGNTDLAAKAAAVDVAVATLDAVGNQELRLQLLKAHGIEPALRAALVFPADATPKLYETVRTLVNALKHVLDKPVTMTATLKAADDFPGAVAAAVTADKSKAIGAAARKLATSAETLREALVPILWAARRAFVVAVGRIVAQAAPLAALGDPPDAEAKKAFDKVTELQTALETAVPVPPPAWNGLAANRLVTLLETLGAATEKVKPFAATVGPAGRPLVTSLIRDLETVKRQVDKKPGGTTTTAAAAPNELAGLFEASDLLGADRRLRVERPNPNPNLVLGGIDADRAVDAIPRFLQAVRPDQTAELFRAWRGKRYDQKELKVWVFRQRTQLFGYNAPPFLPAANPRANLVPVKDLASDESPSRLFLSEGQEGVLPESFVVIETTTPPLTAYRVGTAAVRPRTAYGLSARTTQIDLAEGRPWRDAAADIKLIRETAVYAQAEKLELADVPLLQPVGAKAKAEADSGDPDKFHTRPDEIELDDLYDGLAVGRPVIVEGELETLAGVVLAEPATLASVSHARRAVFGDTPHTRLGLNAPLANVYKRATVVVHGNVVRATHGETRREALGSGDGAAAFQEFALKFAPLTHLPAATPAGAAPDIEVRVDGVAWRRVGDLADLGPDDPGYVVRVGHDQTAVVGFGDGVRGARLPTGVANVRAVYRSGLGRGGNLPAGRINQATDRPLGVKAVVNPLPASGGADRETRDQARRNAPLGTRALGRVVSVDDYADFARTFAGVGKAVAARLPGPVRPVVHLTLGGADAAPLRPESDLFAYLRRAFAALGDDAQPVVLQPFARVLLVVVAAVRVKDGHEFEAVEPRARAALLGRFGYDRRELGGGVTAGEVLTTLHGVRGVAHAALTALGAVRAFGSPADINKQLKDITRQSADGANRWVSGAGPRYRPGAEKPYEAAEVVFLDPGLPESLLLSEVKP